MADKADGQQPQLGLWPLLLYLRNLKGFKWNHKRVYRVYKELELNLRIKKPRKRLIREKPEALTVPLEINQVWSMDFMHDQLEDGRTFRLFNVIDDYNREAIGMEADYTYSACTTVRNTSVPLFITRLQNGESGLNTFSLATHNKMLMLRDLKEQFATNGCHNITGQA